MATPVQIREVPVAARDRVNHIAVTIADSKLELFENGVPTSSAVLKGEHFPTTSPLALGGNWPISPGAAACDLLEVRISEGARYTDAFKPARRLDADADTVALYHFDEGKGDTLYDASGNNHHGKIMGARWVKAADCGDELDRKAALWALSAGGSVVVAEERGPILTTEMLPPGQLTLKSILLGTSQIKATDKDLENQCGLSELTTITLPNCEQGVTDRGIEFLAQNKKLRSINLQNGRLTNDALKTLESLPELTSVSVCICPALTDGGLESLKKLKLQTLHVCSSAMSADSVIAVAVESWPGLKYLGIKNLRITDTGLQQLAQIPALTSLFMNQVKLQDEQLQHLSKIKTLTMLSLNSATVSDAGLVHLRGMTSLRSLDLKRTKVTVAAVAELQKALPLCKIETK